MSNWRARWIAWRNARLSDPRFQQFAADFPLTRGVAHGRAQRLFDVVAGFVYSQVLTACIELDLLNALKSGPRDVTEMAAALNVPASEMARLLRAASALDLVEPIGQQYALGAQGAALLGNSGLAEMIRHHKHLYADLNDPVALLRRGRGEHLAGYWPYATTQDPENTAANDVSAYSALMAATQPAVASDILAAYSMRRHRKIMDVGGGQGAFLSAVAARWPHLQLHLFDLPAVVERARTFLAPHYDRSAFTGGSFLSNPLPTGADLISLVRILHDHDDAGVTRILSAVRAALPPGGRLLIAEPMSDSRGRDRVGDAYFGLYLLAMGRGQARSPAQLANFTKAAGFSRARMLRVRTPGLLRVMIVDQ